MEPKREVIVRYLEVLITMPVEVLKAEVKNMFGEDVFYRKGMDNWSVEDLKRYILTEAGGTTGQALVDKLYDYAVEAMTTRVVDHTLILSTKDNVSGSAVTFAPPVHIEENSVVLAD